MEAHMPMDITVATHSPTIFITEEDFDRLDRLAASGQSANLPAAELLASELERAVVCPAEEIAADVVTMNSRITFHIGSEVEQRTRTLVYPEDYPTGGSGDDCLSVMTPLGAALIGMPTGSRIEYETVNGTNRLVTVDAVLHQPQAAHRRPKDRQKSGSKKP
jgi:regulator of nucleoside diphosphate kinase